MPKKIVVNVTSEDKRDNSGTTAIVEVDRGAGWVRLDSKDIVTNKDKDVEFVLTQGERLVLEAYAPETAAYSRDQAAAYTPSTQVSEREIDDAKKGEQNAEEKKQRDLDYDKKAGVGTSSFQKSPASQQGQERDQHTGGPKVSPQSGSATQQAPKPGPATAANPLKSSKDMK